MIYKYQEQSTIVKEKLSGIGFFVEEEEDFFIIFSNKTDWKIEFEIDRHIISIHRFLIKNITFNKDFFIDYLMSAYGVNKERTIENELDFIIKYKAKLFNDSFPYQESYDKL